MSEATEIIDRLKSIANPEKVLFKKQKFGVIANNALGVMMSDLNIIAREIGKNEQLACELFSTNVYEARILCAKIFPPKKLTSTLADQWVKTFENWEICDTFSMGVFAKSPIALQIIADYTNRDNEFEKRSGFATVAAFCMADKKASNEVYESFFPLIVEAASDERLYVKKAVNWALRSIGKRNVDLNKKAIILAEQLTKSSTLSSIWIGKDALAELTNKKANILDYPRVIYRS